MAEQKPNIFRKMLTATNEIQTVAKNLNVQVNNSSSYKAVSERDILDAVKPIEFKNGIYSYPLSRNIVETNILETESKYGVRKQLMIRLEVVYRFLNVDNPEEYIDITSYADGIDSGDKATGKAMTYADKYALMKAYKISTGEDPDQNASEDLKAVNSQKSQQKTKKVIDKWGNEVEKRYTPASKEQLAYIADIYKGENLNRLLEKYQADDITELSSNDASKIIANYTKAKLQKQEGQVNE